MEPRHPPIPGLSSRRRCRAALALVALFLSGCAGGPSPLADRRTMLGTLRSSVAQLESEKYQFQKELADLRAENRRMEDRLVREQADNELLARRVSEYQRLGRGGRFDDPDSIDLSGPNAIEPERSPAPPRRATPAATPRGPRRPLVQIPGQIRPLEDDAEFEPERPAPSRRDRGEELELFPSRDDPFAQGRNDTARSRWMPIARGIDVSPSHLR